MLLLLAFVVLPIAELYVIIRVGGEIGVLNTIGVVLGVAVIGSWLVKREGWRVWRRFNEALAAGQVPAREVVDGVLVLAAGALLVTPGFLTDVLGILLLFPPSRAAVRAYVLRRTRAGRSVIRGGSFGVRRTGDVVDTDATETRGEL